MSRRLQTTFILRETDAEVAEAGYLQIKESGDKDCDKAQFLIDEEAEQLLYEIMPSLLAKARGHTGNTVLFVDVVAIVAEDDSTHQIIANMNHHHRRPLLSYSW